MKSKGSALVIGLLVTIIIILTAALTYVLGLRTANITKPSPSNLSPSPVPSEEPVACTMEIKVCPDGSSVGRVPPVCEFAPCPTPVTSVKPGWKIYRNEQYGFEISYPSNYQVLDDKDNLYGWPNGIVLIYGGGQSYDLAVEVWNTTAEYEQKYKPPMSNLTVKNIKGKFITLLNQNFEAELDEIITTFKEIN